MKLFFLVIGIPVILCSIIAFYNTYNDEKEYNALFAGGQYTYGVVTEVTSSSDSYSAYGTYLVGDYAYRFYYSSSTMISRGTTVKILYEKDDPSDYTLGDVDYTDGYIAAVILLIMGIVFCIASFVINESNIRIADVGEKETTSFQDPKDVWNCDITKMKNNNYKGKSKLTNVNIGATAYYNRNKK